MKVYQKYNASISTGIIASGTGKALMDPTGTLAITPALENVHLWNVKKGILLKEWKESGNKSAVTCICHHSDSIYSVGYADGTIRLWDLDQSDSLLTLKGHKQAVTALAFDHKNSRLVSGSKDTDIILWDVLAEAGLYRLKGHKDEVTSLVILDTEGCNHIISGSKDNLIKVWDLKTQHCVETLITHRGQVWALELLLEQKLLFSGSDDGQIRVWEIDTEALASKLDLDHENSVDADGNLKRTISLLGALERASKEKILHIKLMKGNQFMGVQVGQSLFSHIRVRMRSWKFTKFDHLKN